MKKILIVSATTSEISPTLDWLQAQWEVRDPYNFSLNNCHVEILITKVGPTLAAFSMGQKANMARPDLVIHAGIAGSIRPDLKIGELVEVRSDRFGFWGAQEKDSNPLSVFDLLLVEPNEYPFKEGILYNNNIPQVDLPQVSSVTVTETTGTKERKDLLLKYYPADIETMETASILYACLIASWPCLSIRAISNYVGVRNKSEWDIPLAISNLNTYLINYLSRQLA